MKSKHVNTSNQTVLLTGAHKAAFGYEFAKLFAQNGFNLILVARAEDKLKEMAFRVSSKFEVSALRLSAAPVASFEFSEALWRRSSVLPSWKPETLNFKL